MDGLTGLGVGCGTVDAIKGQGGKRGGKESDLREKAVRMSRQ